MDSKAFPRLPVLLATAERLGSVSQWGGRANRIGLVCIQHLLSSTGSLFEALVQSGLRPENIFVLGKVYSTHPDTAKGIANLGLTLVDSSEPQRPGTYSSTFEADVSRLWDVVLAEDAKAPFDCLIVLDDGGYALRTVPFSLHERRAVVGIEQTTSGLHQGIFGHFPIIQVAASAAKILAEPPLISGAVVAKLESLLPQLGQNQSCGVVGVGSIGRAVAERLVAAGHHVVTYDKRRPQPSVDGAYVCETPLELLTRSEVVFGCTGHDISRGRWWEAVEGTRMLVSCSSGDIEFRSALSLGGLYGSQTYSTGEDVNFRVPNTKLSLHIIRGGYPINFDGSATSVPAEDIQMTRSLLFGSVFQALKIEGSPAPPAIALDSYLQKFVLSEWFADRPSRRGTFESSVLELFEDEEMLTAASEGVSFGSLRTHWS